MPVLATSEAVMVRAGIEQLPEYGDLIPITDVPGFAVRRSYPANSDLSTIVNSQGEELVKAIIQFIVEPPTAPNGVCSVTLRAWVYPRSKQRHLFQGMGELPPDDPDAPTSDSLQRWRRVRKPTEVDSVGEFLYDAASDCFLDVEGDQVTPEFMLDHVYQRHCRTLRSRFVWKVNAASLVRLVARRSVGGSQDLCMWFLLRCYDVQLTQPRERLSPFHRFRHIDFTRVSAAQGASNTFFGFQSSRKNLITNVFILGGACFLAYHYGPRGGLLSAIYANDTLTAGALVLGFLAADLIGPFLLKTIIIGLSRLREWAAFLSIKVNP